MKPQNDALQTSKWWLLPFGLFSIMVILAFSQRIVLTNSDLGRHLMNGKVFLEKLTIPKTNLYSYTEPDNRFINHHWGSGVIFELVERVSGFSGLSLLNILLMVGGFFFFAWSAKSRSPLWAIFGCAALLYPSLTGRLEVRPESFSFLFLGISFWLQTKVYAGKSDSRLLFWLIPLQALWVNLHIFFVFGMFLVFSFTLASFFSQNQAREFFKKYLIVSAGTVLASLLNPFHIYGVLEPFFIFRQYGFMVAENQSVFFMVKRLGTFYYYFSLLILVVSLLLGWAAFALEKNKRNALLEVWFLTIFGLLALKINRNIPVFACFALAILPTLIPKLTSRLSFGQQTRTRAILVTIGVLFLGAGLFRLDKTSSSSDNPHYDYLPWSPFRYLNNGLGLAPGQVEGARFFRQLNIRGPIFNNYDIGSYLIYYLYPDRKVFVDNRPEAYSVDFFTQKYEPALQSEEAWKNLDKQYGFNAIYFYRLDQTEHGQPFLIRRLADPDWAPLFVDGTTLLLIKRNETNRPMIEQLELPKEMFGISKVN